MPTEAAVGGRLSFHVG